MPQVITVTGDEQAIKRLLALGATSGELEAAMRDIADFAETRIRGVPVDTGRLARSVRGGADQYLRITDTGFDLGTQVPYSRFVFRGTKHMPARPPRVDTRAIGRAGATRINQELKQAR